MLWNVAIDHAYSARSLFLYQSITEALQRKFVGGKLSGFTIHWLRLSYVLFSGMQKDAINAGIIPALTSALTQKLYLEDLNENPVTWQSAEFCGTDLNAKCVFLFISRRSCATLKWSAGYFMLSLKLRSSSVTWSSTIAARYTWPNSMTCKKV